MPVSTSYASSVFLCSNILPFPLFSAICVAPAAWWGFHLSGMQGLVTALGVTLILAVLEVSLSFDNAVVNAEVLKGWNRFWMQMFLTVGILIAVFGMRLVFPIVIVAVTASLPVLEVVDLALNDPATYASYLNAHHAEISAFGGMFLLLVFLNYFLDQNKTTHWIRPLESPIKWLGKSSASAALIALVSILLVSGLAPSESRLAILIAGLWGVVVYFGVETIADMLGGDSGADSGAPRAVMQGGIAGFLYLEVLDASFSFDGVIGAFAITDDVILIMLGLAIGAIFVRSMTIYLVEEGTLAQYRFLAHGAHWAIGALAVIMLLSMRLHVPELVTGGIGAAFIGAALIHSIKVGAKEVQVQ